MEKMNKKGVVTKIIIFWALAMIVLVVVIIAIPNQLLGKTRDVAFSFGIGKLPEERTPSFLGEAKIPFELTLSLENIAGKIRDNLANTGDTRCLIPLDETKGLGRYVISFFPGQIAIEKGGRGGYALTDEIEDKGISSFQPCVVTGNGATNFYGNWLDGSVKLTSPDLEEQHSSYNTGGSYVVRLTSKTEIITPNEVITTGEPLKYEISNDHNKRFLYKADATHFCFISVKGGDCELKNGNKAIGKDCLDSMPFFVGTCDGSNDAVNRFYSNCDSICNKMDQVCIIGIDDGNGDNNLRACYQSFRFEGHDDYCVCGDESEKVIPNNGAHLQSTCKTECGTTQCIMGIDDYKKPRRCDRTFVFGDNPDIGVDYCFCGDASKEVIPGERSKTDCNNICNLEDGNLECIIGIDDSNEDTSDDYGDKRKCDEKFGFESEPDDYCVCGDESEKVIPIPSD
jgi:hypothetical protein